MHVNSVIFIAVLSSLVAGCIGTMDSLHYVRGKAPDTTKCEIMVIRESRVLRKEEVKGKFSVSYMASGPFPSKVDIVANCGGRQVKRINGVSPRSVGNIELGTILP